MAVGVIVGGAFTSIVTSLNQDILTPILGIFGGIDFSNLFVKLGSGENAPVLTYGNFLTAVVNFLITALVIFCLVRGLNKLNEKLKEKGESLELDENDNIKGWSDKLSGLKTQFPTMFESVSDNNDGYQVFKPNKLPNGETTGTLTKEELLKKPYAERARIAQENPEVYAAAMNS